MGYALILDLVAFLFTPAGEITCCTTSFHRGFHDTPHGATRNSLDYSTLVYKVLYNVQRIKLTPNLLLENLRLIAQRTRLTTVRSSERAVTLLVCHT